MDYGTAKTSPREREKETEGRAAPDALVKRYWREIDRYKRSVKSWHDDADNICKLYLDEIGGSERRFAMLWANVETLKPAIYAQTPTTLCTRRYKDRDPVARTAAEIIERATNTTMELYGADEVFRMVRDDRLLPGRGVAWVRYEAQIDRYDETVTELDDETGDETEVTEERERLRSEKVCVDYVYWRDFGHNVARTWSDVWLVWRSVYKTEDEASDRFGADVAAGLTYNAKAPVTGYDGMDTEDGDDYCRIVEVWDKRRGTVSWMTEGLDHFIETGPPPIDFAQFFPCPEPVFATKTSKGLIPKPDYCYYRDQAKEINDLTAKIHRLTKWLKMKAFVPGGPSTLADPIEEAVREDSNSELFVQVESMAQWTEAGGAGRLIDWLPVDKVVQALAAAIEARNQLIQDVYQITGISDIMRAQTDPRETLGAQRIKASTGSKRIDNVAKDFARFCRDVARLVAEVIAEKFEPQTLAEISGYKYVPAPPAMDGMPGFPGMMGGAAMQAPMGQMQPGAPMQPGMPQGEMQDDPDNLTFDDDVVALLRDDRMRSFRVDIETDSTLQPDQNVERESRRDFIETGGNYLQKAAQVVAQAPALAPIASEMLMFAVRGYRVGRTMEETMERTFDAFSKQMAQKAMQPPPEDPAITAIKTKVAGDIERDRAKASLQKQKQDQDAQLEVRGQNIDAAVAVRKQDLDAKTKAREQASRMADRIYQAGMRSVPRPGAQQQGAM